MRECVHLHGVGQCRVQHGEHRQVRAQVGHHTTTTTTQALRMQTRQPTSLHFSSAADENSRFYGVKTGDELMAASLVRPNIGCNVEPSSVCRQSKHRGIKPFRQSRTGTVCVCVLGMSVYSAEHLSAFTAPAYTRRKRGTVIIM